MGHILSQTRRVNVEAGIGELWRKEIQFCGLDRPDMATDMIIAYCVRFCYTI
jgi:hypothetical protein